MDFVSHRHVSVLAGGLLLIAVLGPVQSAAQGDVHQVTPGNFTILYDAVEGGVECFIDIDPSDCTKARWKSIDGSTGVDVDLGKLDAVYSPILPLGLGKFNRAIAWVDYEFEIVGDGGWVNAEIIVSYDGQAVVGGIGAYSTETQLTMTVFQPGSPIGAVTLWDYSREGDVGLDGGAFGRRFVDEVGSLPVTLRRGDVYRVRIAAQASGSIALAGKAAAEIFAFVNYLRIGVDEDEFEALQQHDSDIKDAIAIHDTDIKTLLSEILARQDEIVRLLLTPQGLRESDLGSWPLPGDPPVIEPEPRNRDARWRWE
jgi:hypothetical protein